MIVIKTKPVPVNAKYGVVRGRMLLQKKYRDTKEAIAWEMKAGWPHEPRSEELCLNMVIYLGSRHKTDIDAYLKIILDAGEGVLWENDNLITELHVFKETDLKNPRVELSVL
jgi:Holliday junction resolvase RusA-like endonuclease